MLDPLFFDGLYWFFMQNTVVLFSVGVTTFIVMIVAILTVIKKWGESY